MPTEQIEPRRPAVEHAAVEAEYLGVEQLARFAIDHGLTEYDDETVRKHFIEVDATERARYLNA